MEKVTREKRAPERFRWCLPNKYRRENVMEGNGISGLGFLAHWVYFVLYIFVEEIL